MAVTLKSCFVCAFLVFCCNMLMVSSTEFAVGGDHTGWTIPKSADYYNNWASNNRFLVHDTLRFKYGEDSVIEVNEEDYNKCKASRPLFFSNNGDTVFAFDRPGLFFFISGVSGHCDRGQKIVVKVLDVQAHSPPPQNQNQNQNEDQNSPHTEGASSSSHIAGPFAKTTSALLVVSSFIFLLFA